jgi:poly(3-hydroxybutyrate) depolymerase
MQEELFMPLKKAVNILLLLAITSRAETIFAGARETGFLNRSIAGGGEAYRYQVYVPADFTPARKWPVILFLHGAGARGDDGLLPTDHGIGTAIRRHGSRFPAIVVFPQCRRDAIWFGSMEERAVQALDRSVKEFNGDPHGLYLTGISLGGYGTWQVAARHPGKFAAIVPIAGGGGPACRLPAAAGSHGARTLRQMGRLALANASNRHDHFCHGRWRMGLVSTLG